MSILDLHENRINPQIETGNLNSKTRNLQPVTRNPAAALRDMAFDSENVNPGRVHRSSLSYRGKAADRLRLESALGEIIQT